MGTATTAPTFATNGDAGGQILIAPGDGYAYLFTLGTNAFAIVTNSTPANLPATVVGFCDGYFLALDATTSTLQISALNDGSSWDALDIAQRQTASDPWESMVVCDRQVHLSGRLTTESWYNDGNPDFPFTPILSSLVRQGIAAPRSSLALVDNSRIWLASNGEGSGQVVRSSGYLPQRISTSAIEHAIEGYQTTGDAEAWAYQSEGHSVLPPEFPGGTRHAGLRRAHASVA